MPDVNVTIDGKEVSVPANSTVLDAAIAAGIDVPVLCHHPSLKPIGACRMCLVEIEKQRVLQPACTFPVTPGMVVHTDSPQVLASRRFVLQMLFSERNHYCMFCQMSGNCELQDQAYKAGLTHWEFDRAFPKLPVDASREYFVMDHNRCILCRRCIRACDELVGNSTLGLMNRGADTMVIADNNLPFGESSCISCGTCLQVCPTGALADRASAYMGDADEVTRVASRCAGCSVGCGVEYIVRDNRVIRIEGDWDAAPNKGLLCERGRFEPLHERRLRVRKPLVNTGAGLQDAAWEEALAQAAAKIQAAGDQALTLVSGFATNETAAAAAGLPGQKALLGAAMAAGECGSLECLEEADLYIVAETDLARDFQVAGMAVRRGVRQRGARLIILSDDADGLEPWSMAQWSPAEADKAVAIAREAQHPVIISGPCGATLAQQLAAALPAAQRLTFSEGGNARGIAAAGITASYEGQAGKVFYVVAGEAQPDAALLSALQGAEFVVVQAAYREPWDGVADVILPSPVSSEKAGTMINAEGRQGQIVQAVKVRLPGETELVEQLGRLVR